MAVYLYCSKNRGHQKKHIDVCKKCTSNDDCQEFREYLLSNPTTPTEETQIPEQDGLHLSDFIESLKEIRKLVGNSGLEIVSDKSQSGDISVTASLGDLLRVELTAIRSLCLTQTDRALERT